MFHSSMQHNQTFYPASDCTPHNHLCPHHVNAHSTPICCNSKYLSPVDSCECPYPPAMNKRCVPQQCVTRTPNSVKPSVDQFNTPLVSRKASYPPNVSVSTSPSQCYGNCGCGSHYIEEGVCDSITPISMVYLIRRGHSRTIRFLSFYSGRKFLRYVSTRIHFLTGHWTC